MRTREKITNTERSMMNNCKCTDIEFCKGCAVRANCKRFDKMKKEKR